MHIMKNSMYSRIDTKAMKPVHYFEKRYYCGDQVFPCNLVHGQRHVGFPSLSSTHTKILVNCISHFFQEQEDSRRCIYQKPGEEANLLRTFCV